MRHSDAQILAGRTAHEHGQDELALMIRHGTARAYTRDEQIKARMAGLRLGPADAGRDEISSCSTSTTGPAEVLIGPA
jgi:hypothetical protein